MKAWESFCVPKTAGGLGFKRTKDINITFNTKLAWQLCNNSDKMWILVMRSKYLRGLDFMDSTHPPKRGSWIWNCILDCKDTLKNGICHWIVKNSIVKIRDTPWIPTLPGFQLPPGSFIPSDLHYVKDLMYPDGSSWNSPLLYSIFPGNVAECIEAIQIMDLLERDVFF